MKPKIKFASLPKEVKQLIVVGIIVAAAVVILATHLIASAITSNNINGYIAIVLVLALLPIIYYLIICIKIKLRNLMEDID